MSEFERTDVKPGCEALLTVDALTVKYGAIAALRGVSLSVARGEIVALLGANGAGKSTLMRAISGLLKPTAGSIVFSGECTQHKSVDQIVRSGVSQVPEGRRVFPTLSVRENLTLGGYTRAAAEVRESLATAFNLFPRLKERESQLAGTLSGGEQQMLAIGRALIARPRMLLLDEPSLGLAPIIVRDIFQTLRKIASEGLTILLVEQNARMALRLADRAYVMEHGEVVLEGGAGELLESDLVRASYLGGGH